MMKLLVVLCVLGAALAQWDYSNFQGQPDHNPNPAADVAVNPNPVVGVTETEQVAEVPATAQDSEKPVEGEEGEGEEEKESAVEESAEGSSASSESSSSSSSGSSSSSSSSSGASSSEESGNSTSSSSSASSSEEKAIRIIRGDRHGSRSSEEKDTVNIYFL